MENAGFIVLAAVASSVATWGLAFAWYRLHGRDSLERELAAIQDEFERRVKDGVTAAALELMPQLREEVAQGFVDALKKSQAAGLVEGAAGVMNAGTDIVSGSIGGIAALFGLKPKK
jgi:hypothetical protein